MKFFHVIVPALFLSAALIAQPRTDSQIIEEIREFPYRAGGGKCPYDGGKFNDTPAPEGYKPFYVSHLGRHGSRYMLDYDEMKRPVDVLDTLRAAGLLTPSGDSLLTELRHLVAVHEDNEGMLTSKGVREHMQIAKNLVRRCPELFHQPDRPSAYFTSTKVQRTIHSMAGFSVGILSAAPDLDVHTSTGFAPIYVKKSEGPTIRELRKTKEVKKARAALAPKAGDFGNFFSKVFVDRVRVEMKLDSVDIARFTRKILSLACSAGVLDLKIDPLRFFTAEELFAYYRYGDFSYSIGYSPMECTVKATSREGRKWVRIIVDDADAALEGNGRCADFRFGHDTNLGPLMLVIGGGDAQYKTSLNKTYNNWQSYRNICMGSNVQFIFYQAPGKDILVKLLYNEREINIPGLKAVNGVYYSWKELRRHILSRAGAITEVPDYCKNYLDDKAAEISSLQKDEADGFYFITDTHYPANYGNSPAMIEYLENASSVRPVVFGGDIITYLDDMYDAVCTQICAIQQIRGAAPFYWLRGNHDLVNYTGQKSWITKPRKALWQWDAADLMARYRTQGAVSNPQAPYSAYFYFDNPAAGIRYIAVESTDKVVDNKIKYGISDEQFRWLAGEAVLKAPEGWRLVFFSHVPPVGDKRNSIAALSGLVDAVKTGSRFEVGGQVFDFSVRKDLKPLMIVCGHKHKDYDKMTAGGVRQINVAADCNYFRPTAAGTTDEQSFEYISISKDYKTVRTVKVGAGKSRKFKL